MHGCRAYHQCSVLLPCHCRPAAAIILRNDDATERDSFKVYGYSLFASISEQTDPSALSVEDGPSMSSAGWTHPIPVPEGHDRTQFKIQLSAATDWCFALVSVFVCPISSSLPRLFAGDMDNYLRLVVAGETMELRTNWNKMLTKYKCFRDLQLSLLFYNVQRSFAWQSSDDDQGTWSGWNGGSKERKKGLQERKRRWNSNNAEQRVDN